MADESRLEPAVVSDLFREHAQELHRFLMGVLRDWQLAHDVLQMAFAKAVEVGHTSAVESRKAWLFRVAYHEAMAVRRRQGVDGKALRQMAWTQEAAGAAGDEPAAPAIREETVERVRDAIAQLPAIQQQVLRMRIYEEKTFAVIAEELQIPLGTALARMRTAMEKLRKKLEE